LSWYDAARRAKIWGFDTEGTSVNPVVNELEGFSVATREDGPFWIPAGLHFDRELKKLAELVGDPTEHVIIQNAVYDVGVLHKYGIEFNAVLFDTLIESWLVDENGGHKLEILVERIFSYQMKTYKEVEALRKQFGEDSAEFKQFFGDYAKDDAKWLLDLHAHLAPQVMAEGLWDIYREIYIPLVKVIVKMTARGCKIDRELLASFIKTHESKIESLCQRMFEIVGHVFNPNSPDQLRPILYDRFRLRPKWKKKTKKGYSTSIEVLETIPEPEGYDDGYDLVQTLLEYRQHTKLLSTYVRPMLEYSKRDGRIHASFHPVGTVTGRLSSNAPNLQNIPVRSELGREIRRVFVPTPGFVLVVADYSQAEIRVMAHYSQDPVLRDVFATDGDVHQNSAERMGLIEKYGPKGGRDRGKTANLGFNYDMGAKKFARKNKYPEPEAREMRKEYFRLHRGVRRYHQVIERGVDSGELLEVHTLLGRKRRLYTAPIEHGLRFREAVNSPIQGTVGDLVNRTMVRMDAEIETYWAGEAYLLNQVHDELVYEVKADEDVLESFILTLYDTMCSADDGKLSVPLDADIGISAKNWIEAKA